MRLRASRRRVRLRIRSRDRSGRGDGVTETFPLARGLSERVSPQIGPLLAGETTDFATEVSPVTAELLKFWFQQDFSDLRFLNFHEGQRSAILHVVYAHEVLHAQRLRDLYQAVAPDALL